MKTYRLAAAALFALLLLGLTAALLFAAPSEPGRSLKQLLGNAPILPLHTVKAHSDEWNNAYFDRNVATELPIYAELESRDLLRGGLAGMHPQLSTSLPIMPRTNLKAHSDEWNARYFDTNVNTSFTAPAIEYLPPGLRRGGMAK